LQAMLGKFPVAAKRHSKARVSSKYWWSVQPAEKMRL